MKTNEQKALIRYNVSFKQMVVKQIEQGSSTELLKKKYGIKGGSTI